MQKFKCLSDKRKKWLQSSEENGFDIGIRKLLTDLYPDRAHFIYELLQNAEDAQASEVTFLLKKDKLIFVHDGKKVFSFEDIESITSIADSTKADDGTSVGKFGVGFKAVFAYTNTPYISSGSWNFKIKDMVLPELTEFPREKEFKETKLTYFEFPFDRVQKSAKVAYEEIFEGLKALSLETILFLKNISNIKWIVEDKQQEITKVSDKEHTILSSRGYLNEEKEYLKFEKENQEFLTEDGQKKVISIALAYRIENFEIKENGKLKKKNKVVPTSLKNNVFIFFPAEKEDSHLKFILNAPFASEVSRASIRNTEDNKKLMNLLVDLQKESLFWLRDHDFLTTEFLGILPNSLDELPEMYQIFHEEIVSLFQEEELTPTKTGKYGPSNGLCRSEEKIDTFLTDDELADILNCDEDCGWSSPMWIKNVAQKNSRPDKFLNDLDIKIYNWGELFSFLENCTYEEEKKEVWIKIIKQKSDQQLISLYKKIEEIKDSYIYSFYYNYIPLFPGMNGNFFSLNEKPLIEISKNYKLSKSDYQKYNFIKTELYQDKGKIKEDNVSLLKELGVSEYSLEILCEEIIQKYESSSQITFEENINDIKMFLKALKEKYIFEYQLEKTDFLCDDEDEFCSPSSLMLGKDYEDNPYNSVFKDDTKLSSKYKKFISGKELDEFIQLLKNIGIKHDFKIIKTDCHKNPLYYKHLFSGYNETFYCHNEDYDIQFLKKVFNDETLIKKSSAIFWKILLNSSPKNLKAVYWANNKDSRHECPSTYIQKLTTHAWILDKDGILRKPQDMTFDMLQKGWFIPEDRYENIILKAIHFGENEQKHLEKKKEQDQIAQQAGFDDAEELEKSKKINQLLEETGMSKDELIEQLEKKKQESFPVSVSNNPSRREDKMIVKYQNSSEQSYEVRERSVRTSNNQSRQEAKTYLKNEYTNEEGDVFCQLCHNIMPFKKRNGDYYFETVQMFKSMEKEFPYQNLALCPNCAAEYDEWVRNNDDIKKELWEAIESREPISGEPNVDIEIVFNHKEKKIRFTGKHYIDIRTAIIKKK